MSQFIESIQLLDGQFKRLQQHQARMEKAMAEYYPQTKIITLEKVLMQQSYPKVGLFKCRVVYDSEIRLIEFIPYTPPIIRSLKIVEIEIPSLPYKISDRKDYQTAFSKRADCDDVLIVKNGFLTDTSYCNIALWNGERWFTPKTPLIQGVNRAQLLAEGKLIEKDIKVDDLVNFKCIILFNALNEFGTIQMDVSSISI